MHGKAVNLYCSKINYRRINNKPPLDFGFVTEKCSQPKIIHQSGVISICLSNRACVADTRSDFTNCMEPTVLFIIRNYEHLMVKCLGCSNFSKAKQAGLEALQRSQRDWIPESRNSSK